MSTQAVTTFFALLAVASLGVVAAAVLLALGRRVPALAALRARAADEIRGDAVQLAAVVATVATLGSLFLSEVAGFRPCLLCWVQRGFMYPLAVGLVLAAATYRSGIRRIAAGWALAGAAVSVWHIVIERFPSLEACDAANPCSLRWVEHFGFVTIPVMALAAFLLVAVLCSIRPSQPRDTTDLESELVA